MNLQDQGVIDNGCSRHMTGNMFNLTYYKEIDGGCVAFGRNPKGGKIIEKVKPLEYSIVEQEYLEENLHIRYKRSDNAGQARKEIELVKDYILLPLWTANPPFSQDPKSSHDDSVTPPNRVATKCYRSKPLSDDGKKVNEDPSKESKCDDQENEDNVNSTNNVNTVSSTINVVGSNRVNVVGENISIELPFDPNMPALEDVGIFDFSRIHKDHPLDQVIGDFHSATQTRKMSKNLEEHGFEEPKKTLVDLPNGKRAIGSKWVFRNKKDERGIMIRNKARLIAQGCTQEEKIDYDEVFALVARIEAIRLFLAYASFKDFVVYQMDVKSAFLYEKIEKEVYVCQPPGFKDPDFSDKVYKVEKALYGLHQAPRAWYETLSTYLLDNGFQRVDAREILDEFYGRTYILLGLQVKPLEDGIFISQDKYVARILKKFRFIEFKTASIPMETQKPLLKDEDGEEVDVHMYRSMIGSLMYLTSSRPDIMFAVCACVRYQVNPKVSHLHAVKRIFRKSKEKFWSTAMAKTINWEAQLHAKVDGKKIIVTESSARRDLRLTYEEGIDCLLNSTIFEQLALIGKPKRKDTQVPQPSDLTESVADEVVHKELGDSLVRATTTASSLVVEQDNGNTLQSDENRLKLDELMALCTNIQNRVLDLEKTNTTQHNEIVSLKRRVKKLEKRNRSRTHGLKILYKVGLTDRVESSDDEESLGEDASKQEMRIDVIDIDEDITLVNVHDNANKEMFDVNVLDEITLAQALEALKTSKPKVKGIVFQEPDQIRLDEEAAKKLQAEFDEQERLARERAEKEQEANIALIEEWVYIQAKIDADHQLAERLQAQEQKKLSDAEKATLFQQLLEKIRKHFAAKKAKEKQNKPPTQAQQRKIMCTYLKNMEGYKLKDLKLKEVGKGKRAGEELIQESNKKQKVEDDKEKDKLKWLMETISDEEEVAIDVIPLAVKSLRIVDWKIHKEGKKGYYQIVRADEKSQIYMIFSQMLKSFDMKDLEDLYRLSMQIYMLVEKKYPLTLPTLSMMLEKKLQIDYESEMAYQLCKLIKKQLKK
uniref:Reverse transcriptase Ty1/copia-type domain-containing protein n=1 Tax=Tanacetum cinerariifolium TaxID=118510 RepID=A0A6L2M2Y2_TANCI|nr:hypothetical protein [Tanacetum cinerariifolium]